MIKAKHEDGLPIAQYLQRLFLAVHGARRRGRIQQRDIRQQLQVSRRRHIGRISDFSEHTTLWSGSYVVIFIHHAITFCKDPGPERYG